jgi:hypothetical protein
MSIRAGLARFQYAHSPTEEPLVRATKEAEAGEMPSPEFQRKLEAYNDQLTRAGVTLAAEGLLPSRARTDLAPGLDFGRLRTSTRSPAC